MRSLQLSAAALAVAAGVNTLSVASQLRWRFLKRLAGQRAWNLHLALITPAWVLFAASLPRVRDDPRLALRPRRRLGLAVLGLGGCLWLAAAREIGMTRVLNGDAFGVAPPRRLRTGPYRWLADPIYDSYALSLWGLAMVTGRGAYACLGLESLIVLNLIEARVESRSFSHG